MSSNDLDKYTGTYSNEKQPIKMMITQNGDGLVAQATKQPAFYLEITGKNEFKYPKRDIVIEFDPEKTN